MRATASPSSGAVASTASVSARRDGAPGPGNDRSALADDDRVLNEHRVRAVVGLGHLAHPPPVPGQRGPVAVVLAPDQPDLDHAAVDVDDNALGQPRTRPPRQRGPSHASTLRATRYPLSSHAWRASWRGFAFIER